MANAKSTSPKLKHNSKTTKIKCVHCNHFKKVQRNDAKWCSSLCKVQESNYRKENAWTEMLFEGTEEQLLKLYGYGPLFVHVNPLKNDLTLIRRAQEDLGNKESWKSEFPGFILYHFVNRPSKPYQVFCTKAKRDLLDDFQKKSFQKQQGQSRMGGGL